MSDDTANDPLAQLVVERQPLDRELLANLLQPYVELHEDAPHASFNLAGEKLTLREKTLLYLLARKALAAMKFIEDEKALPIQIDEDTGWGGGSIRPTLRRLLNEKLIRKDSSEEGGYYVPNNVLSRIGEILQGEN